jgi:hypothetical protein
MAENSDRNREDIFKRANAYLNEIPDLRTDDAVNRYLKNVGIDIAKTQEQARTLVTKMIGKRRLDRAMARRANKLSILDRIRAAASKLESSAAQQLQELVKIGDLNGAEMLARKFEASCPEDAASLQDDLALLKEIEKEDGTDASK